MKVDFQRFPRSSALLVLMTFQTIIGWHETLRTQWFGEQIALNNTPAGGDFKPKPVFLKRLGVVEKICFGDGFGDPDSCNLWKISHVHFCFILLMFLNEFGVFEVLTFCLFVDFPVVLFIFCDYVFGLEKA